jgi:hypothetical protein
MRRALSLLAGLTLGLTTATADASAAARRTDYVRPLGQGRHHAHMARQPGHGHVGHYAALVGDPGSGLGFYALPYPYRLGAWRYRQRVRMARYPNPVLSAVAADAARYYGIPGDRGYRYGVFDPNDGVGTPFFAGYYGPGDGDDEPPPPFGRPYR